MYFLDVVVSVDPLMLLVLNVLYLTEKLNVYFFLTSFLWLCSHCQSDNRSPGCCYSSLSLDGRSSYFK